MAGGAAMMRRTRVRVEAAPGVADLLLGAGEAFPLVLAKGLISTCGFETAVHFDGGGALSGAVVRLTLPTAAMRGPLAPAGGAAGASSSAAPKTDRRAAAEGREDGVDGFLRVVGAKRSAADHAAAVRLAGVVSIAWRACTSVHAHFGLSSPAGVDASGAAADEAAAGAAGAAGVAGASAGGFAVPLKLMPPYRDILADSERVQQEPTCIFALAFGPPLLVCSIGSVVKPVCAD